MQAVVVRRKMETPTAVVATLGIELVTLSSYLACPAVSTYRAFNLCINLPETSLPDVLYLYIVLYRNGDRKLCQD